MGAGVPTKIVFGTDGWRARIGDEFTFENVRRLAEGVARVVVQDGSAARGVVIAYDRRFGSEAFAATNRKSTRLNSSHMSESRMPSSA